MSSLYYRKHFFKTDKIEGIVYQRYLLSKEKHLFKSIQDGTNIQFLSYLYPFSFLFSILFFMCFICGILKIALISIFLSIFFTYLYFSSIWFILCLAYWRLITIKYEISIEYISIVSFLKLTNLNSLIYNIIIKLDR